MSVETLTNPLARPVGRRSLSQSSLLAELRALLAVANKEWIIFRRYPSWVVSLFIWPLIFPATYILTARALSGPDGSGLAQFILATGMPDYIGYIGVGTTIWMWQNIVLWDVGTALRNEQMRGTLESNWLSPTWRFALLLGNSITQMLTMLLFLAVTYLEFVLLLGMRPEGSLLLSGLMIAVAVPAIVGLGLLFASLVVYVKEANVFVMLVRGLVMVFSGITFPVAILPGWMQSVAGFLPPTYVINGLRKAMLTRATLADLAPDITALLGFGAVLLALGYAAFLFMERQARRTGAIGQY